MTTQRCCENCECPFVSFRSECPRKFCSGGCHEKDCPCHQQDKSVCVKCGEEIPRGKTYKRNEDGTIQHAPGDYCQPSVCEHRVATMNKIDLIEHIEKCMGYEKPQPSVVGEIEWEKRPYETYEAHLSRIIPRLVEVLNKRTNER